ncbi:glycosyltransferase family 4 protein [Paenibacillus sp. 1P07SE]|uniref:glycosyltransferase family 4 protein n=1 Tax=Paenibacillus sp. 1P07SE TaxID=3132209 RepID=UPI0039A46014
MRKHILLICEAMGGGVRKHVLDILLHLDLSKYRVSLLYSDLRADELFTSQLQLLRDMGIGLYPLNALVRELSPRQDWIALRRTVRLIRELRPDIVHCHSSKAGGIGRLAARWCGIRMILYTPHAYMFQNVGLKDRKRKMYTVMERLLGRITTLTINVSAGERQAAVDEGVLQEERSVLIYNGIQPPEQATGATGPKRKATDAALYTSAWQQLLAGDEVAAGTADGNDEAAAEMRHGSTAGVRSEAGKAADNVISFAAAERAVRLRAGGRLTIGTSARLDEQKDPWTFFRIAREIVTRYDHVDFVYIGDGIFKEMIDEQIRQEGLEERIRLVGFRSNVMELIRAFDIYLITSLYEGLPYSIVEALSLGLPIVATDVIGNNEVVLSRYNGLLFGAQHIQDGAERLARLIEHPELIAYYGKRSRELYEQYFTLEAMMDALIQVYEGGRPLTRPVSVPAEEGTALSGTAARAYSPGTGAPAVAWSGARE